MVRAAWSLRALPPVFPPWAPAPAPTAAAGRASSSSSSSPSPSALPVTLSELARFGDGPPSAADTAAAAPAAVSR